MLKKQASLSGVLIVPTGSVSTAGVGTLNVNLNWQLVSVYMPLQCYDKPVRRARLLSERRLFPIGLPLISREQCVMFLYALTTLRIAITPEARAKWRERMTELARSEAAQLKPSAGAN